MYKNMNNIKKNSYLAKANTHSEISTTFVATVKDCTISKSSSVMNLYYIRKINTIIKPLMQYIGKCLEENI